MKKIISISGKVVFPLREGARAIIAYGGDFIYTSRVVEIFEVSEDFAHFETMNSIYRVALVPNPVTAVIQEGYAKCA
jgi:hypothetical protein